MRRALHIPAKVGHGKSAHSRIPVGGGDADQGLCLENGKLKGCRPQLVRPRFWANRQNFSTSNDLEAIYWARRPNFPETRIDPDLNRGFVSSDSIGEWIRRFERRMSGWHSAASLANRMPSR